MRELTRKIKNYISSLIRTTSVVNSLIFSLIIN